MIEHKGLGKMTSTKRMWVGMAAGVALVMAGCGGGGGGGSTAGIDGTGATGPGDPTDTGTVAFGAVTAFGSIFVNGVRFDTSSASITIDGENGSEDDLDVGDVVLVTGTLDAGSAVEGVAATVVFDDAVEGPIESVDPAAGTFVVLGQIVRVVATTSFDDSIQPASIDGVSVGLVVEVSGFVASDGTIEASRVEPKPASTEFETTGIVSGLDTAATEFMINALVVDYGSAMLSNFQGGVISEGDLVEVKGSSVLGPDGELVATEVEFKGGELEGDDGDHVEIEGFITRFVDESDFDVSGFAVTTNAQTVFEGGGAGDLGLDVKVEVEGELDANGVLVADEVDIRRARAVRVFAAVDSAAPASDPDAAPGTGSFAVLGITVDVDALTRREDKTDLKVSPFGVDDLAAGDHVEVRGTEFPAGSGRILAGLVERDEPGDPADTELRGFVTGVTGTDLTILGVTIMTGASTQFRDAAENPISSIEFFSQVTAAGGDSSGSLVEVRGIETAPQMIMADEVELEAE